MDQDAEVADFLRDLMEKDGDSGRDADRDAGEITRSDDQAVDEIMHRISDEIHDSEGMDMFFGDRHMTVIPTDHFFGKEPEEDSCEDKERGPQRPMSSCYHLGE